MMALELGESALLLFKSGYMVSLTALGVMIVLAFRVNADYHDGLYLLLGSISALFFVFGWGGEHFLWPIPGLIWQIGLVYLMFTLGLFVGWLLPFDSDVLVRKPIEPDQ